MAIAALTTWTAEIWCSERNGEVAGLYFLDGLRVVGALMVHLGHILSIIFGLMPTLRGVELFKELHATPLIAVAFIFVVDTFFFTAGLLAGFKAIGRFHTKVHRNGSFKYHSRIVLKLALQRWFRFGGLIILSLLVTLVVPRVFRPAVLSKPQEALREIAIHGLHGGCRRFWPAALLLTHNLWFAGRACECLGWIWYIDIEFQLFIVTLILFAFWGRNRTALLRTLCFLVAAAAVWSIRLAYLADLGSLLRFENVPVRTNFFMLDTFALDENYFFQFYVRPEVRAPPYFLGVILALYTSPQLENGAKLLSANPHVPGLETPKWRKALNRLSALAVLLGQFLWLHIYPVSFVAALLLAYAPILIFLIGSRRIIDALYQGLARTLFGLCLIPIYLRLMRTQKRSCVYRILAADFFVPFSRLSYSWYFAHIPVLVLLGFMRLDVLIVEPLTLSNWLKWFLVSILPTFLLAVLVFVLVEAPCRRFGVRVAERYLPTNQLELQCALDIDSQQVEPTETADDAGGSAPDLIDAPPAAPPLDPCGDVGDGEAAALVEE